MTFSNRGSKRQSFLLGIVLGMMILYGEQSVVATYRDLTTRLSYIEGYLGALDQLLHQGR